MSKYDFMSQVEEQLKRCPELDGALVEGQIYIRNNDTECYGIAIRKDDRAVSPIFYIDRFYEDYLRKKLTIPEITKKILVFFSDIDRERKDVRTLSLDWEDCRDRITYRLVSATQNRKFLSTMPYIPFLDLAIIFTVFYRMSDEGLESIRVTDELADAWGVDCRELLNLAKVNTPRLFPAVCDPMIEVMGRFLEMDVESLRDMDMDSPMRLLSNEHNVYGATSLLYEEEIDRLGERLRENFYVIPSSIHEVLILPESAVEDPDYINSMIRQINREHLGKVDILSDKAYYYDRSEKRFYF